MKIFNQATFTAADSSKSQLGSPFDATYINAISSQAVLTGTPATGTFKLQQSNDAPSIPGSTNSPLNWNDVPGSLVPVSGSGSYMFSVTNLCANWCRVVYTPNSGNGTITVSTRAIGD